MPERVEHGRALVVVDDPELRRQFAELFGGIPFAYAPLGPEAVSLVEREREGAWPFSVAFVQRHGPPGWDGPAIAARFCAASPLLQIVLCTAPADESWVELGDRAGGMVENLIFLRTPLVAHEVQYIVHTLQRRWQLRVELSRALDALEGASERRAAELAEVRASLQREIHDRLRVETELRLAQKLEAVGQLAAGIAHEINTPMQYIGDGVSFLQLTAEPVLAVTALLEEAVGAMRSCGGHGELLARASEALEVANLPRVRKRVPRAFERTLEGIDRVTTIVRAMKEFAHPDQHEQAAADLGHGLENALLVSRNEYKYVADVETRLADLPPVMCHLGELNQVFLNLIINAAHAIEAVVKGSNDRGRITVTSGVNAARDWVWIEIADSGCGIPAAIADRIFDPFFTTKPVGKGTGQGLAIARSIVVDKHGGRLTFHSAPGEGTRFRIELPVHGREIVGDAA